MEVKRQLDFAKEVDPRMQYTYMHTYTVLIKFINAY
jgi:hypothetical protein